MENRWLSILVKFLEIFVPRILCKFNVRIVRAQILFFIEKILADQNNIQMEINIEAEINVVFSVVFHILYIFQWICIESVEQKFLVFESRG